MTKITIHPGLDDTLEDVKRWHIERVLRACEGNRAEAAKVLGVDRRTTYRMIDRYKIDIPPMVPEGTQ